MNVLFLQNALEVGGDAHIGAQLLDGGDGGIGSLGVVHLVNADNAHCLADGAVTLARDVLVVLQTRGQDDGTCHTVGGVIQGGQTVRHTVDNA